MVAGRRDRRQGGPATARFELENGAWEPWEQETHAVCRSRVGPQQVDVATGGSTTFSTGMCICSHRAGHFFYDKWCPIALPLACARGGVRAPRGPSTSGSEHLLFSHRRFNMCFHYTGPGRLIINPPHSLPASMAGLNGAAHAFHCSGTPLWDPRGHGAHRVTCLTQYSHAVSQQPQICSRGLKSMKCS